MRIQELETQLKTLKTEKDNLQAEHTDLLLLLSDQDSQLAELTQKLEQKSLSVAAPAVSQATSSPLQPVVTEAAQNSSSAAASEQQSLPATESQNTAAAVLHNPESAVATTASAVLDTPTTTAYPAQPYQAAGQGFQLGYATG
ncbi:unnamed protein product, partial [Dibothriocephalus latus]